CSSFYDMTLYCYHNSHSDEVYRRICKTLRKEYGLFTLYAHSSPCNRNRKNYAMNSATLL
ncbi:hypothetical protein GFK27_21900, partial [Salmonella enterica subsp. enterica serovar Enteritidis]|nr:hypothetical protein [Salmonella enterica subsp. enterica serovar Enteritidis]